MVTPFHALPITGIEPEPWVAQATVTELSAILTPLLEHEEVAEFGWSQAALQLEGGDSGSWHVGATWLRTIHDADRRRDELGFFLSTHPTLSDFLYEKHQTPLQKLAEQFFETVRDSAYMSALLELFGAGASVVVSRAGITLEEPGGELYEKR